MRRLGLILLWWLAATPLHAQTAAPPPPTDASAAARIDQADDDLADLMSAARKRSLTDADIKSQLAAVEPVKAEVRGALAVLDPDLQDANARLAQLGPAPGPGRPAEPPETAASRASLTRSQAALDAEVKQARLLLVEADQIAADLSERLRQNFSRRLWTRSRSVLDPALWAEFAASTPADLSRLNAAAADEGAAFHAAMGRSGGAPVLILTLLAAIGVAGPGRLVLGRLAYRWASRGDPSEPLRQSGLALWLFASTVTTALVAGLMARNALAGPGALTPVFAQFASLAVRALVFAVVLEALGRSLLSPGRPAWRMAPIPDDIVARLAPYPGLIGLVAGLSSLVSGVNVALGVNLSTSVAGDCCVMLVEAAVIGAALAMTARARKAHMAAPANGGRGRRSRLPWALAAGAAWLALLGAVLAMLLGYLALAAFLMRETVWIGAVLALMFLTLAFTDELFPALLAPTAPLGRAVEMGLGLSRSGMEQIGVLASGLGRLALLVLGWGAILAPFGAGVDDVVAKITAAGASVRIGQATVSPGAVIGAIALLVVGLGITRAVRGWFETRYLPKTRLDVGLRSSATSALTYLGAAIAILVAFTFLGVSFSQLALLAGALSVGIGFGLQAIIGNFVSGLILLAERPVAVGDWIAIGDLEGDVRRINIRATEIEMADKSKLIVPNSDLVSKTVRNVSHAGAMGRVKIVLKVDDSADPAAVRDLLMARVKDHKEVLREPAPAVFLSDVRDGALEFTAFAYVASPRVAFRVKSDLLFGIVPELRAHGVALANATPVINVGMQDRLITPDAEDTG